MNKMGEQIEVKIVVAVPCNCTKEQFEEWVKFQLKYIGGISANNPLSEHELEAKDVFIY